MSNAVAGSARPDRLCDDAIDGDPLGDTDSLLAELRAGGVRGDHEIFAAYFIRFGGDFQRAEAGGDEARHDGWDAVLYGDPTGHVLRLSRLHAATASRLRRDREYLLGFVARCGGRWDALALEELVPDDYWEQIAERFAQRTADRSDGVVGAGLAEIPVVPAQRRSSA